MSFEESKLERCASDGRYTIHNRDELLRKSKDIKVPVHGTISITMMAKCFIDSKYFQRLRHLKQLSTCEFIFPGANHTRFEHSLGTYYLADKLTDVIKKLSDQYKFMEWLQEIPELKSHYKNKYSVGFDDWIIELIKIAALCHDIGHGPYSHLFDDVFIKSSSLKDHKLANHEQRSCMLVERIVEESEILSYFITNDDIKFIQSVIDPDESRKGFIYEIVSNNKNGIDVDKIDYLERDALHTGIKTGFDYSKLIKNILIIDNMIVYPEQADRDIYNLFTTRHAMHLCVYGHKGTISAQYIILEIMKIVDKVLNLSESILDIDEFFEMTDTHIIEQMKFILKMENNKLNPFKGKLTKEDYINLKVLRKRFDTHELYNHIGTLTTNTKVNLEEYFNKSTHFISYNKIGFVSGNKPNPLDHIYVYNTKDYFINGNNVKAHKINKKDITHIMPETYQEYRTMVFRKDNDSDGIKTDKQLFLNITNKYSKS